MACHRAALALYHLRARAAAVVPIRFGESAITIGGNALSAEDTQHRFAVVAGVITTS
jgi:hypothetical protein